MTGTKSPDTENTAASRRPPKRAGNLAGVRMPETETRDRELPVLGHLPRRFADGTAWDEV
jgi:hypothetical protein